VAKSARQTNPQPTASNDGIRRAEILDAAADLFGNSGFRASMQELAEACGILPGSLYHHFESKEALIVELVQRYLAELDAVAAEALDDLQHGEGRSDFDRIAALADAISRCAIRNRAALLQTFYDPPVGASDELVRLAKRTPAAVDQAMLAILERARNDSYLRKDVDLELLTERIRLSMLHTGIGVFHRTAGAQHLPTIKTRMLLEGLAAGRPSDAELDGSSAFAAAEQVIAGWRADAPPAEDDRGALLRAAARGEFARRGYDSTTMRDIASAAGVSVGLVYRLVSSKDELLASIMGSYIANVEASWGAILASDATPVQKLDALVWVDINLLDRFREEFKIQMGWLRQSPPNTSTDLSQLKRRERRMRDLLSEGERSGELRNAGGSLVVRTACLLELTWISQSVVERAGPRGALRLARDTLIRGAVTSR
jgi:AcrR family transcriptional regulator